MSQEFFVNSIKELLTGELGYVSQSIYADVKKNKQTEWKKYNESTLLTKVRSLKLLIKLRTFLIAIQMIGIQPSRYDNIVCQRFCRKEHTKIQHQISLEMGPAP